MEDDQKDHQHTHSFGVNWKAKWSSKVNGQQEQPKSSAGKCCCCAQWPPLWSAVINFLATDFSPTILLFPSLTSQGERKFAKSVSCCCCCCSNWWSTGRAQLLLMQLWQMGKGSRAQTNLDNLNRHRRRSSEHRKDIHTSPQCIVRRRLLWLISFHLWPVLLLFITHSWGTLQSSIGDERHSKLHCRWCLSLLYFFQEYASNV